MAWPHSFDFASFSCCCHSLMKPKIWNNIIWRRTRARGRWAVLEVPSKIKCTRRWNLEDWSLIHHKIHYSNHHWSSRKWNASRDEWNRESPCSTKTLQIHKLARKLNSQEVACIEFYKLSNESKAYFKQYYRNECDPVSFMDTKKTNMSTTIRVHIASGLTEIQTC